MCVQQAPLSKCLPSSHWVLGAKLNEVLERKPSQGRTQDATIHRVNHLTQIDAAQGEGAGWEDHWIAPSTPSPPQCLCCVQVTWTSLVAQMVKNPPAVGETWVWSLGWEDLQRRERLPTPVFWLGEFLGQRSLAGYTIRGVAESGTTERLSHFTNLRKMWWVCSLTQHLTFSTQLLPDHEVHASS